ncbi:MAG: 3',5'-cyclic-nucleotide phosphodiesterase [Vezdaea aestivalis]|nr:MAG: 3',5'-cyclic-nucleotide phosphodiesterase [Vezdaea aestivalis]
MDRASCKVIYLNRRLSSDNLHLNQRQDKEVELSSTDTPQPPLGPGLSAEIASANKDIRTLLAVFDSVHACCSAPSCIEQVSSASANDSSDLIPTLVFIDTSYDDAFDEQNHSSSPRSERRSSGLVGDALIESLSGLRLLKWIANELRCERLSKLIIPIAVVDDQVQKASSQSGAGVFASFNFGLSGSAQDPQTAPLQVNQMLKYLDAGAVDVARSPFSEEPISRLAVHAYRAHKDVVKEREAFLSVKRARKRSWVGVNDEVPYAYLRESMVSGLMDGICKPEDVGQSLDDVQLSISAERRSAVADGIGSWSFSAHDYCEDELLLCASLMLQHALAMPELEPWRIPADQIEKFLGATRAAYNEFVPYHNFRHVVDVLQAVFYFLVQLGLLNDYPANHSPHPSKPFTPIAKLLSPFEALTLLITAIGHDVGHPGVNNQFLVVLKAPLAQLYNDQSVLESFHCAAYSQLLRRHWSSAFQDARMRTLMIRSILATDMGLHFDYMKKLGFLQEKLHENQGTDGWDGRTQEEQRTLACSLLIKCADISNVARKYNVAAKWADILTTEFARQASMETDLGIPSTLFAPPIQDDIVELGKSQIGFMNLFALPLFQGVTDVLPPMQFSVDELNTNKARWQARIEEEGKLGERGRAIEQNDGFLSPRSGSIASVKNSESGPIASDPAPTQDANPAFTIPVDASRPNSMGTFGPNGRGWSPDQSRRSSLGSPLSFASPEMASRRSSGASPTGLTHPPRLEARRSSNTVPSQLQLGLHLNDATKTMAGAQDSSIAAGSFDQPLLTKPPTTANRTMRQPSVPSSKSHKHSFSERYQVMSSSGDKAAPVNGTSYPYSPLSGATSVMSSTEKVATVLPKATYSIDDSRPQLYETAQSDQIEEFNASSDSITSMRRHASRFRLNFWKSKRRVQAANSSI